MSKSWMTMNMIRSWHRPSKNARVNHLHVAVALAIKRIVPHTFWRHFIDECELMKCQRVATHKFFWYVLLPSLGAILVYVGKKWCKHDFKTSCTFFHGFYDKPTIFQTDNCCMPSFSAIWKMTLFSEYYAKYYACETLNLPARCVQNDKSFYSFVFHNNNQLLSKRMDNKSNSIKWDFDATLTHSSV